MILQANPFPGLRPFEPHESKLFFGRDEQCDELLARLARRRLVAVVGASGSGKSSLVRAGLLPALQRGYLPVAGSAWQIALFRPGGDPIANLTAALLAAAASDPPSEPITRESLAEMLDASSLGLVAAARRLRHDDASLLIIVDQFEEIFRFRDIARASDAEERAVNCVQLLLAAAAQEDVPIYVVLTMRSDYLGDCAQFTGLPEALNDSQFLVPRMTREQLRAAIEGPVAVAGGRITARLVQRLLHDVDVFGRMTRAPGGIVRSDYDHDQLPVLQHALMRVWDVSAPKRDAGVAIDLEDYEQPPVETIHHALDRHADEVYTGLPSDAHRQVARKIFQRLTERDVENRDVRRPTPMAEVVAVAGDAAASVPPAGREAIVRHVVDEFAAPKRAFVVVNAQQDVDISHESFIRKWNRLHQWVVEENHSRKVYVRLAETAAEWQRQRASLYRGPELAEAARWWSAERPTRTWADRYHAGFDLADRFLVRSRRQRRLWQSAVAVAVAASIVIAMVMGILWVRAAQAEQRARAAEDEARAAEEVAKQVRDRADQDRKELQEAIALASQALEAERAGNAKLAASLDARARDAVVRSATVQTLTPSELREVERHRALAEKSALQVKDLTARLQAADAESASLRSTAAGLEAKLRDATADAAKLRDANTSLSSQLTKALADLKDADTDRTTLRDQLQSAAKDLETAVSARDALAAKLAAGGGSPGGGPITGTDYRDLFRRGLTAASRDRWSEAAELFEAAARIRGDTGEPVSLMPRGNAPYLPNYHLGVARRQLACQAWEVAGRDGGIKKTDEFAKLAAQLKFCEPQ